MGKKRVPTPIGMSMLDLISNSLAAMIILFIIISSLRLPMIPPERIKGTLFVRYTLERNSRPLEDAASQIWVTPPGVPEKYWGDEILLLNHLDEAYGLFTDCAEVNAKINTKNTVLPLCILVYSPADSANVHYLVIRDPLRGEWRTGLLYVDHDQLGADRQEATFTLQAWFVSATGDGVTPLQDTTYQAPTEYAGFKFETPDWKSLD